MEALRRARYKFAGRQKIIVSKKWGFTSLDRADYEALRREHKVMPDGAYVQVCQPEAVRPRSLSCRIGIVEHILMISS